MQYIVLLLSGIGLFYARKHRTSYEKYFLFKLFIIWLLSIITVTISGSMPLPFGLAISLLIYINTKSNRRAKLMALLSGLIGYILSLLIYVISH